MQGRDREGKGKGKEGMFGKKERKEKRRLLGYCSRLDLLWVGNCCYVFNVMKRL
jgi:hypothetical protein